jgi:SnoaL-like domain
MPGFISDSPLARALIRVGDEAIAREDDAALRAYFSEDYVFHGPGGDLTFDQLRAYFGSLRAAFADLRLVVSRSSRTATSWRHAPRSPVTSPGSLPTRPSARSSPPDNTSSGN